MKTLAIAVAFLLLQTAPVPPASILQTVLEGTVLNSENQPVSGAEVTASWQAPPAVYSSSQVPRTVTDSSGHFAFRNLEPGGYRVGVRAPGYVAQQYGKVVTLDPTGPSETIALRLAPESVISGRIISTTGTPLVKMDVFALRRVYDSHGWSSFARAGAPAETNDRGEYRIAGLAPGRYYVRASSPFAGRIRIETRQAERGERAAPPPPSPGEYAPIYFPGVSDISAAAQVNVQSAVTLTNLDFMLPRLQLFKIRGTVRDSDGSLPARRVSLGVVPANATYVAGFSMSLAGPAYDSSGNLITPYRPDGTFELTDVAPGTYWLNAQLEPARLSDEDLRSLAMPGADLSQLPAPPRGSTLFKVIDSDVNNVDVVVFSNLSLNGSVRVEGPSNIEFASLKLEMHPIAIGQTAPSIGKTIMSADGRFTHSNLTAAEYRVALSQIPPGFYVKESRFGGIDALTGVLPLLRQPLPELEVVLSKGFEVSGSIVDGDRICANQEVILIPDGASGRPDLYRKATTNSNGVFTIQGIAAGDYRAYAWKEIEPFRYFDPEFVRDFVKQGAEVHVVEASSASVRVNLIR